MAEYYRVSESCILFCHTYELHKKISDRIEQSNLKYKLRVNVREKFKAFNVGNYVMVRIRPKRFPPRTVKKLHVCGVGPFKILNKINDNMHML